MLMRTLLLAGMALALLVGCGDDDGSGGSTGGERVAKLSGPVTYERGGGSPGAATAWSCSPTAARS
jgi:hypothetical protein